MQVHIHNRVDDVQCASIWSCVSAERRDRKLPWSRGVTLPSSAHTVSHCERCEVTQNELLPHCRRGGGPIFWFVSIMLISPLDISAGHPFLSVCFSESSVLISTSFFAPPPRKHPRVVCAELILPLMSLCVSNFHPDYFEFALIWRVTAVGCLMSSKWGGRKKDIWAEEWER